MTVLFVEAVEDASLQAILLDIVDAPLNLAFVTRRVGAGRENDDPVVLAERFQLRIQLRIEPVRLLDRRTEVVDDQYLGHAAEVPEGILQAADEVLGRLPIDDFAVALAAVAQHNAEDVGAPLTTVFLPDGRPGAEVDLRLLARLALQPPERQRMGCPQAAYETTDAPVTRLELLVLSAQILPDPLGRQAQIEHGQNLLPKGLAIALRTRS